MRLLLITILAWTTSSVGGAAAFDLGRLPTDEDLTTIRSLGWAVAADELEEALADQWQPAHFAQSGSSRDSLFRHWQLLQQWCRLLGTPEPEALRSFLARRTLESEEDSSLTIVPAGMALPTDGEGRLLSLAPDKIDPFLVPPQILQSFLPEDYELREGEIASRVGEDFLFDLAGDAEFLREFFAGLTPDDFSPVVLMRLAQLSAAYPEKAQTYRSLMLAFAMVYDQRAPAFWPHRQVRPELVPGRKESLADRFAWFAQANDGGRMAYDLRRLSAEELKFLVDVPLRRSELEWAADNVRWQRGNFDRAFGQVDYDHARVERGEFVWEEGDYLLVNLESQGGICTDQAYFAAMAGKAKGIPTLYFAGQGMDGGHAWFGYLRREGKWDLEAGRFENQNYTVGVALDPQTWLPMTDHQLLYLSGRSRRTLLHDAARGDLGMVEVLTRRGDLAAAQAAAESAMHHAPDWAVAWEAKERALESLGDREGLRQHYEEAIRRFAREDDLKVRYQRRLAALEREGGNSRRASLLEKRMVRENRRERADLSTGAAWETLTRLLEEADYDTTMREYRRLMRKLGRTGGGNLFYDLVRPLVRELRSVGRSKDATKALKEARQSMRFEQGSVLAQDFAILEAGENGQAGPAQ